MALGLALHTMCLYMTCVSNKGALCFILEKRSHRLVACYADKRRC